MHGCEHFVQFYESDAVLLDAVAAFNGDGLRAGEAGIVIATPSHCHGIEERLRSRGFDVDAARSHGQFVALDAADTLARIISGGKPDPRRFAQVVGGVVSRASRGGRPVRVFGEMVALVAHEGNYAAAVRLEELWNDAQETSAFSLFCAYPLDRLNGEPHAEFVDTVCAMHSRVVPAESYAALPTADQRDAAIAALQQRARWLESEIVERQRVEERLRSALAAELVARQEAEAALHVRDEFLSIAAHELRNPLTVIAGRAQLALRRARRVSPADAAPETQALEAIARQTERLSCLIDRLLVVSRLEAGIVRLEPQPTDIALLLEHAVAGARVHGEQHTIALNSPRSLKAVVDPLRLEQVFANLLDNAIRHNPAGGSVDVVLAQPDPDTIEFSVRDHGPGIPTTELNRIFDRFYQAGSSGLRGGLGLGLYISRQIVALHGGEIRVESAPDGGTRFVVTLPTAPRETAAPLLAC
jgi:signal transduction histidine kinase